MPAVRTAAHPVVELVATGGLRLRPCHCVPDLPEQTLPISQRECKDLLFDFFYIHVINIQIIAILN
jgi:hypothetical protein